MKNHPGRFFSLSLSHLHTQVHTLGQFTQIASMEGFNDYKVERDSKLLFASKQMDIIN